MNARHTFAKKDKPHETKCQCKRAADMHVENLDSTFLQQCMANSIALVSEHLSTAYAALLNCLLRYTSVYALKHE